MNAKKGLSVGLLVLAVAATGCGDDETGSASNGGSGAGASGGGGAGAAGGNGASGGAGASGGQGGAGADGGSGGSGGSGGTSMGASAECQECVENLYTTDLECSANIQVCDDDPACNAWKDCNELCFQEDDTVACYAACDTRHPHDEAFSEPLLTCTCDACDAVCPASCAT